MEHVVSNQDLLTQVLSNSSVCELNKSSLVSRKWKVVVDSDEAWKNLSSVYVIANDTGSNIRQAFVEHGRQMQEFNLDKRWRPDINWIVEVTDMIDGQLLLYAVGPLVRNITDIDPPRPIGHNYQEELLLDDAYVRESFFSFSMEAKGLDSCDEYVNSIYHCHEKKEPILEINLFILDKSSGRKVLIAEATNPLFSEMMKMDEMGGVHLWEAELEHPFQQVMFKVDLTVTLLPNQESVPAENQLWKMGIIRIEIGKDTEVEIDGIDAFFNNILSGKLTNYLTTELPREYDTEYHRQNFALLQKPTASNIVDILDTVGYVFDRIPDSLTRFLGDVNLSDFNGHEWVKKEIAEYQVIQALPQDERLIAAIRTGNLKWVDFHYWSSISVDEFNEAIRVGKIDVIDWLYKNDCEWLDYEMYGIAIENGNINVLNYLYETFKWDDMQYRNICDALVQHESPSTSLLEWLIDKESSKEMYVLYDSGASVIDLYDYAVYKSAQHGHVHLVDWMNEKGYLQSSEVRASVIDGAFESQSIAPGILEWCFSRKWHEDVDVIRCLVESTGDNPESNCYKWLVENNYR